MNIVEAVHAYQAGISTEERLLKERLIKEISKIKKAEDWEEYSVAVVDSNSIIFTASVCRFESVDDTEIPPLKCEHITLGGDIDKDTVVLRAC